MIKIIAVILGILLLPLDVWSAEITLDESGGRSRIFIKGQIAPGDDQKVASLMGQVGESLDGGVIIFDSYGGSFPDGIKLADTIFEKGWGTLVESGARCVGPCAYAFLGGRFFGVSGGSGIDRELEPGSTLVFTPFQDNQKGTSKLQKAGPGPDLRLAGSLLEFGVKMKIAPGFMARLFNLSPAEYLAINTPDLLKELQISVRGKQFASVRFGEAQAMIAARNLVHGYDPGDWDFSGIKAGELTPDGFKKIILEQIAALGPEKDLAIFGLVKIALAKNNASDIAELCENLNSLKVIPFLPASKDKVIVVSGLANIHYYQSRIAWFIISSNEQGDITGLSYMLLAPVEIGWNMESGYMAHAGDLFYDLYPANEELWPVSKP